MIDIIVATRLNDIADAMTAEVGFGFLEAAKKHRQVMDVVFPASIAIERGLDDKSQMCVAQEDIEKYYDNLVVLRVARWLERRSGSIELITTLVSMHSCPRIELDVGGERANFYKRAAGMFTGSRSAAAAGRFPVLDVAILRLGHWQHLGLSVDGHSLGLSSFVDNLFSIARSPSAAIYILEDCESFLLSRWGLKIGSDSKEYLACHEYPLPVGDHPLWERKTTMRVLGHQLDNDGSVKSCSDYAMSAMCKAFYGNLRPSLKNASKETKIRFLRTCVCSISKFRWPRWPFTRTLADKLDACQRRFLYNLFPMSPYPHEMMQDFFARRHRAASRLACSSGKWSKLWARDVLSWHAHVQRGHDTHAWSPHVLNWRGHNWLRTQRLWNSAVGESRTNTRAYRGHVHRRWQDGVEFIASHQIL